MEPTVFSNIVLAVCASVSLTTVVFSCTLCLRYLTSVTVGAEPVAQAKRAALRNTTDSHKHIPPTITVEISSDSPQTKIDLTTQEDLGMSSPQDHRYFSDAYSLSDVTTSPADSPMTSPINTPDARHKIMYRLNSVGVVPQLQSNCGKTNGNAGTPDLRRALSVDGQTQLGITGSFSQKRKRSLGLKRSLSVPNIRELIKPEISFTITYDSKEHSLVLNHIEILNLNLPEGEIRVKMHLCPMDKTARTDVVPVSAVGHVPFDLGLRFNDLNESDLQRMSLLVTLTYLSRRSGKKKTNLGEVLIKVSEVGVKVGSSVKVSKPLHHRRRQKKMSTSSNCLLRELGDLFVLLQYQSHASRIKVLIRKAARLPSGGKLPGQPDHFVVVALRHGAETLGSRETRTQKGTRPVWNEPFLFDISGSDVSDLTLEFTLRRGRIYTKDNVLGHVVIGAAAPPAGAAHWKDAISPTGTEVARWHPILPVFIY